MITFFLLLLGLSAIPCIMILPALLNKRQLRQIDRKKQNILIAKQRRSELEQHINSQITDTTAKQQAEIELQEALLDDISDSGPRSYRQLSGKWSILIILALPLAALMIYGQTGSPEYATTAPPSIAANNQIQSPDHDINGLLQRLENAIEQNPQDPRGWELAAKTYMTLRDFPKAELAYAQLNRLITNDANYLAGWADATIMSNDSLFNDHARNLINSALKIDPNHINALWLAGLGAESLGENKQALSYLNKLLPLVADDEQTTDQVKLMIKRNLDLLGLEPEEVVDTDTDIVKSDSISNADLVQQSVSAKVIPTEISIASNLFGQLNGNETLFIFARATTGSKIPLAVSRHSVRELPLKISLTSTMAMLPGMTIEQFEDLTIIARISMSGDPIEKPGDFSSMPKMIDAQYSGDIIPLTIDTIVQ